MNHDALLRILAVAAAVALLAAPYAGQIRAAATAAAEAVRQHSGYLTRVAAAGLLIAAAWGKVPMPTLPTPEAQVVIEVEEPTPELRRLVEPVRTALASASMRDRATWAETWLKSGVVVAADNVHSTPVLADVRALRAFQVVALDVAWRRIAGVSPGKYPGLKDGVEAAFAEVLGLDDVAVDASLRERYVALVRALAWAAR
jgi:hypothetical protein